MDKQHILLVYGGQSSEHDISLISANGIYEAIDTSKYETSLIKITKHGRWIVVDSVTSDDTGEEVQIDISNRQFRLANGAVVQPDVVVPVLHGKYGEDGTIQGLFELMKLPFVGCGVEASALCMDKVRAKQLLEHAGIAVAPSLPIAKHESYAQLLSFEGKMSQEQFEYLVGGGPWFVKPSRAGSSVGVTKVHDASALVPAAEVAFKHDDDILIEQAIDGHEVEVAVLGNTSELIVSKPGIIIPGAEFYSYEDKYAEDSMSQVSFTLPDSIAHLSGKIRLQAETSYRLLGCKGLSRVDFFVTDEGAIYLNEINTMPGFTSISMYPKLMQGVGVEAPQLVDKLIQLALE